MFYFYFKLQILKTINIKQLHVFINEKRGAWHGPKRPPLTARKYWIRSTAQCSKIQISMWSPHSIFKSNPSFKSGRVPFFIHVFHFRKLCTGLPQRWSEVMRCRFFKDLRFAPNLMNDTRNYWKSDLQHLILQIFSFKSVIIIVLYDARILSEIGKRIVPSRCLHFFVLKWRPTALHAQRPGTARRNNKLTWLNMPNFACGFQDGKSKMLRIWLIIKMFQVCTFILYNLFNIDIWSILIIDDFGK